MSAKLRQQSRQLKKGLRGELLKTFQMSEQFGMGNKIHAFAAVRKFATVFIIYLIFY